jgi:hypothetical protein
MKKLIINMKNLILNIQRLINNIKLLMLNIKIAMLEGKKHITKLAAAFCQTVYRSITLARPCSGLAGPLSIGQMPKQKPPVWHRRPANQKKQVNYYCATGSLYIKSSNTTKSLLPPSLTSFWPSLNLPSWPIITLVMVALVK